jgi:hypothetical protein
VSETLKDALDLVRAAKKAGIKHGVVQDKLFLPGLLKLKLLIDSGFFGRILSVRGEFGYWVFEGDWQPAQRPSWNYKKAEGGGIILDMVCHWRYVLDNLFGDVESVTCLGATHIPKRVDENGKTYTNDVDDAAYATVPAQGRRHRAHQHVVVHAGAPRRPRDLPCRRHARLGGGGPCRMLEPGAGQHAAARCGIPDVPQPIVFSTHGRRCRARRPTTTASRPSGRCSSATLRGRAVQMDAAGRRQGPASGRGGHKSWKERRWIDIPALKSLIVGTLDRCPHPERPDRRRCVVEVLSAHSESPTSSGRCAYTTRAPKKFPKPSAVQPHRLCGAHVVADPLADREPWLDAAIDWDTTIAFRGHLWSLGLGVAEAMDTAQRGMGMDWPNSLELIRRSLDAAKDFPGALIGSGAGTDHLRQARTSRSTT